MSFVTNPLNFFTFGFLLRFTSPKSQYLKNKIADFTWYIFCEAKATMMYVLRHRTLQCCIMMARGKREEGRRGEKEKNVTNSP